MKRFSGIWPAMVTPFGTDGKPSLAVVERLVDLFATQELDGLYITGSTGQWPLLSLAERKEIAEVAVRASGGRIPIMVHIGAHATEDAMSLARHAEQIGADAVSTVAPPYYPHSADVIFEHYRQVGGATGLPLFVYHIELAQRLSVGAREFTDRVLEVPNIAGMKITIGDLFLFGLIHAFAGDRLRLFSGADELLCHAVMCGSIGAIGTFYNVWGTTCRRAYQAMRTGQVDAARSFMITFQSVLAEILSSKSIWSFERAAMRHKFGIDIGMPRAPLGALDRPWDDRQLQAWIERVDSAI